MQPGTIRQISVSKNLKLHIPTKVFVAFIFLYALFLFSRAAFPGSAGAFPTFRELSAWKHTTPLLVNNILGKRELTDYQIVVKVDTASLISQGKMRSDLGDIRVTDERGNGLPYWIEFADTLAYDAPRDYVACWKFDEGKGDTVSDESPSAHMGTVYGAQWVKGRYGHALSFDGIDDYVLTPVKYSQLKEGFTWEAWVQHTKPIMGWSWIIGEDSGADVHSQLGKTATSQNVRFQLKGVGEVETRGVNIADEAWHHVAGVWEKGVGLTIYVDGAQKAFTESSGLLAAQGAIRIGAKNDGFPTEKWNGLIDEVRIYERALSSEEIRKQYEETSRIWVKIPVIPAKDVARIFLHYGNPDAGPVSRADATFILYDDFLTAEPDAKQWDVVDTRGWCIANGMLQARNTHGRIKSKRRFNHTEPVIIETRARYRSMPYDGYQVLGNYKETSDNVGILMYPDEAQYFNDGSRVPWGTGVSNDTWHHITQTITESGVTFETRTDDVLKKRDVLGNLVENEPIVLGKRYDDTHEDQQYEAYWDWIKVRKYSSPEPIAVTEEKNQPSISHVAVRNITTTSAIVTWQTDEPSNSMVRFGTRPGHHTMERLEPSYGTRHQHTLTGLTENTVYHFVLLSTDLSGNQATSLESSFKTITLSAWKHKTAILVNNRNNDHTLTEYQILVEPDTASLIAQGKIRPDLGDIRFSDEQGNVMPYWIEFADTAIYDESRDYVACWKFDEGSGDMVKDNSPNKLHGTVYGATWTEGKFGKALRFDGEDDYVLTPVTFSQLAEGFTWEAWVMHDNPKMGWSWVFSEDSAGDGHSQFGKQDRTQEVNFSLKGVGGVITNGAILADGKWHHIAGVWEKGIGLTIYIDGVKWASQSLQGSLTAKGRIRIGAKNDGYPTEKWNGMIDEVRIYGRPLSSEEIKTQYMARSRIWVRLPSIPARETMRIYLHHGNPNAVSDSNGEATFDFFDDFSGTQIDTRKWEVIDASGWHVIDGMLAGKNTSGRLNSRARFQHSQPVVIETKTLCKADAPNGYQVLGTSASVSNGAGILLHPYNEWYSHDKNWIAWSSAVPLGIWFKISQTITETAVSFDIRSEENQYAHHRIANSVEQEPITLGKRYDDTHTAQSYEAYWDWIAVRKYASPKPITVIGKDAKRPAIRAVKVNTVSGIYATVAWETDEISSTRAQYGKAGKTHRHEAGKREYVTHHKLELPKLSPGTTYFISVISEDPSGNRGVGKEISFKTPSLVTPKTAFVVGNPEALTDREKAADKILSRYALVKHLDVEQVKAADPAFFDSLVFTDHHSDITAEELTERIEKGASMVFLFDSGKMLGGNWDSGSGKALQLRITDPSKPLSGYDENSVLKVQAEGKAWYVKPGLSDWNQAAVNLWGDGYISALWQQMVKEGQRKEKALIFTYDPAHLTEAGIEIFSRTIEWLFQGVGADAGPDRVVSRDETIILDGSLSWSPSTIVSHAWDLNGDGAYDDAKGLKPSFQWGQTGTYTISLMITDENGRSDRDDAIITVVPNVDLTVSAVTGKPSSPIDGEMLDLTATIENLGADTAEGRFGISLTAEEKWVHTGLLNGPIAAKDSRKISLPWKAVSGPHTLEVTIDHENRVVETDEANNLRSLEVREIPAADFRIKEISWSPSESIGDGTLVTFTAVVENPGAATLRNSVTGFYIDGQPIGHYRIKEGMRGEEAVSITKTWKAKGGDHEITVVSDVRNEVKESDEDNNTLSIKLPPVPIPDLALSKLDINPFEKLTDGQAVTICAEVTNVGSVPTLHNLPVHFIIDGRHLSAKEIEQGLTPDESASVAVDWIAYPGKHTIKAHVNPYRAISESSHENNARTLALQPITAPNLLITGIETKPAKDLRDGQNVEINASIKNEGAETLRPVEVIFHIDGREVGREKIKSGLVGDAEGMAKLSWKASAGDHVLKVTADPFDSIREASEDDNSQSRLLPAIVDITPPRVTGLKPREGSTLHHTARLEASGTDNVRILRFTFEYSVDQKEWKSIGESTESVEGAVFWNTTDVADGTYFVRATAHDAGRNSSSVLHEYTITNKPLNFPERFKAKPGEWLITLSWDPLPEGSFQYYNLYRSIDDKEANLIASKLTSTVYFDRNVDPSHTYGYRISAVDTWNREGARSDAISAKPRQQTSAPTMVSLMPLEGKRFSASLELLAEAEDAIAVVSCRFEYSADKGKTWRLIAEEASPTKIDTTKWQTPVKWDTKALKEGDYLVRATAFNRGDLKAVALQQYRLDKVPPSSPQKPVLSDPRRGKTLDLSWKASAENDVVGYYVFRSSKADTTYRKISSLVSDMSYRDEGLTDGTEYAYVITTVDEAGNESKPSKPATGVPSSRCDLAITLFEASPKSPPLNQSSTFKASVENRGPASGKARVVCYLNRGENKRETIGSAEVIVASGETVSVDIPWQPKEKASQSVTAELKDISPLDNDPGNNKAALLLRINTPPVIPPIEDLRVGWGEAILFDASAAFDEDGTVVGYLWDFGDGTHAEKARLNHAFSKLGVFTVKLTVTDNDKAGVQNTFKVTVTETRPDLFIEKLSWEPKDPKEKDNVTITAILKNQGKGPTTKGFFATYYIDDIYAGYQRVNKLIGAGESTAVTFKWKAVKDTQTVKVRVDDIQNNLPEIDEDNNEAAAPMTTRQVFFPDLTIIQLDYLPKEKTISSQESVKIKGEIKNIGDAPAERFWVSLSVDGKYKSRRQVAILKPKSSMKLDFKLNPIPKSRQVKLYVDNMVGSSVVESNEKNNEKIITLPEYTLKHPDLKIKKLTWQPKDTILSDGSSLTILATIANSEATEVKQKFSTSFYVDDKFVGTREVSQLASGGETTLSIRWRALPGEHKIRAVIDEKNEIAETDETNNRTEAATPELEIIYPDLTISDVNFQPKEIKYGKTVNFIANVSNTSLVSTLSTFHVSLYVDGIHQKSQEVPPLSGHASVRIPLDWKANLLGEHEFKFMVNDRSHVVEQIEDNNELRRTLQIGDSFKLKMSVDDLDPLDPNNLPIIYGSRESMLLWASISRASAPRELLGSDSGVTAFATIKHSTGKEVLSQGRMIWDPERKAFKTGLSLKDYWTGSYHVKIAATDQIESSEVSFDIVVYEEVDFALSIEKGIYQRGEPVHISGSATYLSGKPVANKQVFLAVGKGRYEDQDMSPYITKAVFGIESPEGPIREFLIRTDENGHLVNEEGEAGFTWQPMWGDAGTFTVNAFIITKRILGTFGKAEFKILGLDASPRRLTVATAKNSQLFKAITWKNMGDEPVTNLKATFVDENDTDTVIVDFDDSKVPGTLPAGGQAMIYLNFDMAEDAPDEVFYEVNVSTAEGVKASSKIRLQLRPALPAPRFEPEELKIGINPGETTRKTITVTNKGFGTMRTMRLIPPSILPWITVESLGAEALAPGDSTTFELTANPPPELPLGVYVDRIGITNGQDYAMPLTVEVTSANRGSISFVITNDAGETVPGARITLAGKTPHVGVSATGERTTFYKRYAITADTNGTATLTDGPVGEYDYTIGVAGHRKASGTVVVQPLAEAAIEKVVLTLLPVQFKWTVTPTEITDTYDITLKITFAAKIPKPKLAFVPPWAPVPHETGADYTGYITVINPSLVELHDVVVKPMNVPGISLSGGGLIGSMPPESSRSLAYKVRAGNYDFLDDTASTNNPKTYFEFTGSYVDFDPETLLARDSKLKLVKLPIVNPGKQKAVLILPNGEKEEIRMPERGDEELKLPGLPKFKPDRGKSGDQVFEMVKLEIPQKASLEREAFDCNLELTNGHTKAAMDSLKIEVRVEGENGADVTNQFYQVVPETTGIEAVDGSDGLRALSAMAAYWQIIPGEGLGGKDIEGQKYFVKAQMTYFVNGRLVQTQTQAVEITVHPQPKLYLHYYLPKNVYAYEPFKLGLEVENVGDGPAKNLRIESGQPRIVENKSGLLIDFKIVNVSFGEAQKESFKLDLGDIPPHGKVSGYWLLTTSLDGYFAEFTAEMTHRLYKGVQLNPLILGVDTRIIEKDDVTPLPEEPENRMSLIDEDDDGFPDYMVNLKTGRHLSVTVPGNVTVTKPPTAEDKTMTLRVPPGDGYMVVMQPDQLPESNVCAVTKEGPPDLSLGLNNMWKADGNLYFVHDKGGNYTVDYRSGLSVEEVQHGTLIYAGGEPSLAFYDAGIKPNAGDPSVIRAKIYNRGIAAEKGTVNFYDDDPIKGRTLLASKEVDVRPFHHAGTRGEIGFTFGPLVEWRPENPGKHQLVVEAQTDSPNKENRLAVPVNAHPAADAGHDFTGTVATPVKFDGTNSRDTDGFIRSFMWDFGDGIWGYGVGPNHSYSRSGTYKATLHLTDDNNAKSTETIQVTIKETRADLVVENITIAPKDPKEGDTVSITAVIKNQGFKAITEEFYVGFYVDGAYKACEKIADGMEIDTTKAVEFTWSATPGNHMFAAVADDFADAVDEADEDNNKKTVPLYTDQVNFPDLTVSELTWSQQSNTVGWGQPTTFTAMVNNAGTAPANSFRATFYVDDEYIAHQVVDELDFAEGENSIQVAGRWIPEPGDHIVSVKADAPIPHVAELDETNNEKSLKLPTLNLKYPNLVLRKIAYLPADGKVNAGDPLHIMATIANDSETTVVKPFDLSFYANGTLIGTITLGSLEGNKDTTKTLDWLPAAGEHDIIVKVDEKNLIVETKEDDNSFTLKGAMISISHPDLVVSKLHWSPESPKYGDTITFFINIKNIGKAPTQGLFRYALDINGIPTFLWTHPNTVMPGASVIMSDTWVASLPTGKKYELKAAADIHDELKETDEGNNGKTVSLNIAKGLILTPAADKKSYTPGESPLLSLTVAGSDSPDTDLSEDAGISAQIKILDDQNKQIAAAKMAYDKTEERWWHSVAPDLLKANSYTALFTSESPSGGFTQVLSFQVRKEIELTLVTDKARYKQGETVRISGVCSFTDGEPIANTPVELFLYNGVDKYFELKTDETGRFSYDYKPVAAEGGHYSVEAIATFNEAERISTADFTIQGLLLTPSPCRRTMLTDSREKVEFNVRNVGSSAISGLKVSLENPAKENGLDASIDASGMSDNLAGGQSTAFSVMLDAGLDRPEDVEIKVTVSSLEGHSDTTTLNLKLEVKTPLLEISTNSLQAAMRAGDSVSETIVIKNEGMVSITNIKAVSPERLPWITLATAGLEEIIPWQPGMIATTPKARGSITVFINPPKGLSPGLYNDVLKIHSNAGTTDINLSVEVTTNSVGSIKLKVRDSYKAPAKRALVSLAYQSALQNKLSMENPRSRPLDIPPYSGFTDEAGIKSFHNIPTGIYSLSIKAPFLKPFSSTLEVLPNSNVNEKEFLLEHLPIQFNWDITDIKRPVKVNSDKIPWLPLEAKENPALKVACEKETRYPRIQLDKPGYEYLSSQLSSRSEAMGKVIIRNPSTSIPLENLKAEILSLNGPLKLEEFLSFGREPGTEGEFRIGTLDPQSMMTFFYKADPSILNIEKSQKIDGAIRITGSFQKDGEETPIETNYFIRLNASPSKKSVIAPKESTIRVAPALGGKPTTYSRGFVEFLNSFHSGVLGNIPQRKGSSLSEARLSQQATMVEESFGISVSLLNPLPLPMEDINIEVIITDVPLDSDGNLPPGGHYIPHLFDMKLTAATLTTNLSELLGARKSNRGCRIEKLDGKTGLNLNFKAKPIPGAATDEDLAAYIHFIGYYTVKGELDYFVQRGGSIVVKPPPKIYLSYSSPAMTDDAKTFLMDITITNTGYGPAHNLIIQTPGLHLKDGSKVVGWEIVGGDFDKGPVHGSIPLEQLAPGETKRIHLKFETNQPAKPILKQLPSFKLSGVNPMNAVRPFGVGVKTSDLLPLIKALKGLENEIHNYIDTALIKGASSIALAGSQLIREKDWNSIEAFLIRPILHTNTPYLSYGLYNLYKNVFRKTKEALQKKEIAVKIYERENLKTSQEIDAIKKVSDNLKKGVTLLEKRTKEVNGKIAILEKQIKNKNVPYNAPIAQHDEIVKDLIKQSKPLRAKQRFLKAQIDQTQSFIEGNTERLDHLKATLDEMRKRLSQAKSSLKVNEFLAQQMEAGLSKGYPAKVAQAMNAVNRTENSNLILSTIQAISELPSIKQMQNRRLMDLLQLIRMFTHNGQKAEEFELPKELKAHLLKKWKKQGLTTKEITDRLDRFKETMTLDEIEECMLFMFYQTGIIRLNETPFIEHLLKTIESEASLEGITKAFDQAYLSTPRAETAAQAKERIKNHFSLVLSLLEKYQNGLEEKPAYYPAIGLTQYIDDLRAQILSAGNSKTVRMLNWHTMAGGFGTCVAPLGMSKQISQKILSHAQNKTESKDRKQFAAYAKLALNALDAEALTGSHLGNLKRIPGETGMKHVSNARSHETIDSNLLSAMENQMKHSGILNLQHLNSLYPLEVGTLWRVASDVEKLFTEINKYKKVDPALPVTVLSVQTPDVTLKSDQPIGMGIARVTLRNEAPTEIEVLATIQVLAGTEAVEGNTSGEVNIPAGETAVLSIPFRVVTSRWLGRAGYDCLIFFRVSEPSTFSVFQTVGPFYGHFYAGTEKELESYHRQPQSQPLGGTLKPGQSHEVTLKFPSETSKVRMVLTRTMGAEVQLHLYDTEGNHSGMNPEREMEVSVARANSSTLEDIPFILELMDPGVEPYRVMVKNKSDFEVEYTLFLLELTTQPAALILAAERIYQAIHSKSAFYELQLNEQGETRDVVELSVVAGELSDGKGNVIPAEATVLNLPITTLLAGMWATISAEVKVPADLPDGIYEGPVTITGKDATTGRNVSATALVTIELDTAVPDAPTIESIDSPKETNSATVTGRAPPRTVVIFYLDGDQTALSDVDADGHFSIEIAGIGVGEHRVTVKAQDVAGNLSLSSKEVMFTRKAVTELIPVLRPLHRVIITPDPASLTPNSTQQFTATAYDVQGNVIPDLIFTWSVVFGGGSIDDKGLFTAATDGGSFPKTIRAKAVKDGVTEAGYASVNISVNISGEVLFSDDFSNPAGGFEVIDNDKLEKTYMNEKYVIAVKKPNWLFWSWAPGDVFPADFQAEVDVEAVAGKTGQWGIVWGKDKDNYHAFMLRSDGSYRLRNQVNNEWQKDPVAWTKSLSIRGGNEQNRMKVIVIGDIITLIVNDTVLKTLQGVNLGPGKIGLIAGAFDDPDVQVRFDNLAIYSQILFNDNFSDPASGFEVIENDKLDKAYVGEKYQIAVKEPNWIFWSWAPGDVFPADFQAEVDVEPFLSKTGQWGIVWGKDKNNYHAFVLRSDGSYRLRHQVNDVWQKDPVPWTESPSLKRDTEANHLMVIVIGDIITLIVNDTVLKTIQNVNFGPGKIGLITGAFDDPDVQVRFDNLMIRDLSDLDDVVSNMDL